MKLYILLIFTISLNIVAAELNNCVREESDSLWVEHHTCGDTQVQVGHELFNNSLVLLRDNNSVQHYQEKDNELNMEYLKNMRRIRSEKDQ